MLSSNHERQKHHKCQSTSTDLGTRVAGNFSQPGCGKNRDCFQSAGAIGIRRMQSELVAAYSERGEKHWRKKDLEKLAAQFHVGLLVILRRLLDHRLTTKAFYNDKHEKWNKPTFGRSKNPEGRNIPKETINEKGRTYIELAFRAFDQNRIDRKDLYWEYWDETGNLVAEEEVDLD